MKTYDNYLHQDDEFFIDEQKDPKGCSLRTDNELFDEDDYKNVQDTIGVRWVDLGKNSEDWEITKNGKAVLVLKGVRFTNAEKRFLRSVDGTRFIIEGYKQGWRSVSEFKRQVKAKA